MTTAKKMQAAAENGKLRLAQAPVATDADLFSGRDALMPPFAFSLRSRPHRFRPFLWQCHRDNPYNKMLYPLVRTSRFAMSMPSCNHPGHNLRPVPLLERLALLLHLAAQKGRTLHAAELPARFFDRCPPVSRIRRSMCRNPVFERIIDLDHRAASWSSR